ncbi:uncharacterized protein HD556DRAFT_1451059 [Suillus plorans]|uniref:Uncharacterized protein n=1 Tax=Suillus plorans TaxID=116603 RepID=A0A9P7A9P4_9AGAM|nr:uncharacterized protein HD556DRAFT_1451059 [Suillus plorans]KAG1785095.1 hypothetical protein HD556DRAFT_1451059 [Suillus plorans]
MPNFFLNVYSIHNYDHIQCIVPDTLHEIPLWVTNIAEVQVKAIHQLQDKRTAKKGGDTFQIADSGEGVAAQPSLVPPSAFDHASTKLRKPTCKAKAKTAKVSTHGPSTQGKKGMAPAQQDSGASQQHQTVSAPSMGGPSQHFYLPTPQPPHPLHQSFPLLLPISALLSLHSSPLFHQSLSQLYCPPPQSYLSSQSCASVPLLA